MDIKFASLALIASLFNYGSGWNIILLVIIGCSVASFTIFIERLMQLHRSEINTNQFIIAMRRNIKENNIVEAIQFCEQTGGTIGAIIKAGILKHNRGKEQIESAMEIAGLIEIARLEKNAKILSIIAHIAPLIGSIGNCIGLYSSICRDASERISRYFRYTHW